MPPSAALDDRPGSGYSHRAMSDPLRADENQLRVLRALTPDARLRQALELSERTRRLFEHGLRRRFPDLGETELRALVRERLDLCHNRNY